MIDLKLYDKERRILPNTVANKKLCDSYIEGIRKDRCDDKNGKFYLGVKLIELYHSGVYGYYMGCDGSSKSFFVFCKGHFDISKSEVSRLMNIVDEFGDGRRCFSSEWSKHSYSVLCELLPLGPEERKQFGSNATVSEVRAWKKAQKAVATSQQDPNDRFKDFSRKQLIEYIYELEDKLEALSVDDIDITCVDIYNSDLIEED